jgi:hypothetical protein
MLYSLLEEKGKEVVEHHFYKPPIFIGGCARSGTTLLLSILSAHPEIHGIAPELGLFKKWRLDHQENEFPVHFKKLYRYFANEKIGPGANRFCEKTPKNIRCIEKIDSYLEGKFRFIHIVRDGRDVCVSRHPKSPDKFWVEPERWVRDVELGLEFKNHPKVFTLKYEELIQDFDQIMKRLCEFLDLKSYSFQNWCEHSNVQQNIALTNQIEPIYSKSMGNWMQEKHSSRVREFLETPHTRELLLQLGYK